MNERDEYYKVSWGGGTAFMMVFIYFILISIAIITLLTYPPLVLLLIIVMILPLTGILYVPKGYRITDKDIIIERRAGNITIPISEIENIEYSPGIWFAIVGTSYGGAFGYSGTIYDSRYGAIRLYSKRLTRMVMITTISRKNFLIAPIQPKEFIEEVEKLMLQDDFELVEDENIEEMEFAEVVDY